MKRRIAVSVREQVARLKRMGRHDQLAEVLERMDKELGRPSARDGAWARRVLGL